MREKNGEWEGGCVKGGKKKRPFGRKGGALEVGESWGELFNTGGGFVG